VHGRELTTPEAYESLIALMDSIGMGAIIMNGANIAPHCLVGAGALVTEGKSFPARSLILGAPARLIRPVTDEEVAMMRRTAAEYVRKARAFKQSAP